MAAHPRINQRPAVFNPRHAARLHALDFIQRNANPLHDQLPFASATLRQPDKLAGLCNYRLHLELKRAIENEPHDAQVLELGDVLVVATILAEMLGTTTSAALALAYEKISKRTGRMIDGQFVKD
jgi:hypothetical protein